DGPSPRFLRPCGEESDEVEQRVTRGDQAIEPGFFQTNSVQIVVPLVVRQHRDLGLDLGGNDDGGGAFVLGAFLYFLAKRIAYGRSRLIDIAYIKHWQRGEQRQHVKSFFLLRLARRQPRRLAVAQQRKRALDKVKCVPSFLCLFVGTARSALEPFDALLQAFEIGEH